jgi:hypothetical protein
MQMYSMIFGAGSVGPFASRAFVPAFITAAMLRFAPQYTPWFPDDLAGIATQAPSWFTSDISLIIFGLLAALEIAATKSPDIRAAYQEVDKYAKSIVAVITYMGIASVQDVGFVERATQQAGFVDAFPALMIGIAVLWMGTLRAGALSIFTDADEDDDIGVQGLFSWAEDVWAFMGPVLLLVFPIIMLILIGIVAGVLVLMRRRAEKKEERSKTPCANCGELIYGAAVRCFACKTPIDSPRGVSLLGLSLDEPTPDPADHPYKLVQKKRCPVCATRFEKRAVHQACEACGHELFADPAFADAYLARLDARLPLVLLVSIGFSLIPVLGLIPGVIYYRMTLIGPMRRYIPRTRAILLRWLVRLAIFLLIMFQWVPGAGGLVVPIMALLNYTVYRSAFRAMLRNEQP